jgi:hypothetical protein
MSWFERASDRMNLRLPNSVPFHLRVRFHAYPGLELLPPDQAEILTGEGLYEETWLSTYQWRREVTLGDYHAVETQSVDIRKMTATSDYVPSRVIMLMDALLNPISRYNSQSSGLPTCPEPVDGVLIPALPDKRHKRKNNCYRVQKRLNHISCIQLAPLLF